MTVGKPTTNGAAPPPRPTLREAVKRLAPGTALRDGLERILRGRTGALIVLGFDDSVEAICDGGFSLDVRYAPTKLRELCKMDGAVVNPCRAASASRRSMPLTRRRSPARPTSPIITAVAGKGRFT